MPAPSTQNARVVEALMKEVSRLRPLPAAATQAIQILGNPQVDIKHLGTVLSADQVIAAQILRHANSAYYGGITPCTTVAEGIVRIGTKQLKSVLYGVAAGGMLGNRLSGYQMKDGELYRHSLVVATAARRLGILVRYPDPEEAFTAGLLHDIGKLLLDRHMQPRFQKMADEVKQGKTIIQVEETHIGTDHATIGGLMAERWSLPRVLVDAIGFHHAPTLAAAPRLAAIVAFANIVVLQSGIGLTPLGVPPLHPEIAALLKIVEDDMGRLAYTLRPEIEAASRQFQTNLRPVPA
ncbi:MAG: HDOD domain-containing protein [Chloroflexi bacterium]|nr:HDOD domain-containing protein [Chloroflexota bacterium]